MSFLEKNNQKQLGQRNSNSTQDLFSEFSTFRNDLKKNFGIKTSTHESVQQIQTRNFNNYEYPAQQQEKSLTFLKSQDKFILESQEIQNQRHQKFKNIISPSNNDFTNKQTNSQKENLQFLQQDSQSASKPRLSLTNTKQQINKLSMIQEPKKYQQYLSQKQPDRNEIMNGYQPNQIEKKQPNISQLLEETRAKSNQGAINMQKNYKDSSKNKQLTDVFPLNKIHELEDLLVDQDFNNIQPQYLDELCRLSSLIMFKVKATNNQNRKE